jgi:tetratricopeptide (TPR) repeat protein
MPAIPSLAGSDGGDMGRAIGLFTAKNYVQALPLFTSTYTKDPSNAVACLYAAHSYFYLKDFASAKRLYTYITQRFPGGTEAAHAAIMLNKISDASLKQAMSVASANAGTITAKEDADDAGAKAGAVVDLTKNVHVIRPQADHPYVSDMLVSKVRGWVQTIPRPVAKLLAEHNVQFAVTPTLVDLHPEMANTEGAGYDGATLKQCPGMYEPNEHRIVICERTVHDSDNSVSSAILSENINDTFFHELGHAVDFCLNEVSQTAEFQRVYRFDEANLRRGDAGAEKKMAYFLQKADRGQIEACGELIGVLLGIKRNAAETTAAFPNTIEFLRKKLKLN